jgi:hypothetical protein
VALRIYELQIDEWNKREYAAHGVSIDEVFQVLDKGPVFLRNSKGHAATILMIGPTGGGRFLTIPLQPINEQRACGGRRRHLMHAPSILPTTQRAGHDRAC